MNIFEENGLCFELNDNNLTAKIISSPKARGDIFIPRSVSYDFKEYLITKIDDNSFLSIPNIETVKFANDSEIQYIGNSAFKDSLIRKIWIPNKVSQIGNKAFQKCDLLEYVHITEESELETIGTKAFHHCSIEKFFITEKVTKIGEGCFGHSPIKEFIISPNNKSFSFLDDQHQIIVGKTNPSDSNFDFILSSIQKVNYISIPSTIQRICSFCFSRSFLEKVEFSDDSELKSIGKSAFSQTNIKKFFIPSKVDSIDDRCFHESTKLKEISISPNNQNFIILDNSTIVGKSDKNSENYDVIIYSIPFIKKILIPSFIKHIKPYSFYNCKILKEITITNDSELETIGKYAFSETKIQKIFIPKHVKSIKKRTFYQCRNLQTVTFSDESELESIGSCAFSCTSIAHFTIPSNVIKLKQGWLSHMYEIGSISISPSNKCFKFLDKYHYIIIGKSDINEDSYDTLIFANRNIIEIVIPSFIKHISSCAFENCQFLETITFSEDSKLESIGSGAFAATMINQITIPAHVKKICDYTFNNCECLTNIEFAQNSELCEIDTMSFMETAIEEITIPSKVTLIHDSTFLQCMKIKTVKFQEPSELTVFCTSAFISTPIEHLEFPSKLATLEDGWCCMTYNLNDIKISPFNTNFIFIDDEHKLIAGKSDLNLDVYDNLVFACRDIQQAIIPPFIKNIGSYAFANCEQLIDLTFSDDSQLESIEEYAFLDTSITEFTLPSHVIKIGSHFLRDSELNTLNFADNCELETICEDAFYSSPFIMVIFPPSVKCVQDGAFKNSEFIRFIEFLADELCFGKEVFDGCDSLCVISFPNSRKISFDENTFINASTDLVVFVVPSTYLIN